MVFPPEYCIYGAMSRHEDEQLKRFLSKIPSWAVEAMCCVHRSYVLYIGYLLDEFEEDFVIEISSLPGFTRTGKGHAVSSMKFSQKSKTAKFSSFGITKMTGKALPSAQHYSKTISIYDGPSEESDSLKLQDSCDSMEVTPIKVLRVPIFMRDAQWSSFEYASFIVSLGSCYTYQMLESSGKDRHELIRAKHSTSRVFLRDALKGDHSSETPVPTYWWMDDEETLRMEESRIRWEPKDPFSSDALRDVFWVVWDAWRIKAAHSARTLHFAHKRSHSESSSDAKYYPRSSIGAQEQLKGFSAPETLVDAVLKRYRTTVDNPN